MTFLHEIPHPSCKISVYHWNSKYIVKFETTSLEQVFKVSEFDLTGEEPLKEMITDEFIAKVMKRFDEMDSDWEELAGDDY